MKDIFTKLELDSFLATFKNMILDLIISTENIDQIIQQNNENREKIIPINSFLGHYVALAYSYSALTLSKLFILQEKRSLKKFFNKLENIDFDDELELLLKKNSEVFENGSEGEYDYLFKNKADIKKEIDFAREELAKAENIIEKIKARRDSYYAHYDPDKNDEIEVESLSEIKQLCDVAQKIYDRFYAGFYNSSFIFINYWELNPLFNIVNEHYNYFTKMSEDLEDK